jgi:hypothetical protein
MKIMNYILYFRDKNFLSVIWLPTVNCIVQGSIVLILVLTVWVLTNYIDISFLETVSLVANRILYTSILLTVSLNLVLLLKDINEIKAYLSSPTIVKVSTLSEIRIQHKNGEFLFAYIIPMVALVFVGIAFLLTYFSREARLADITWAGALLFSLMHFFAFPISFLVANIIYLVLQVFLLNLKYIIHWKQ